VSLNFSGALPRPRGSKVEKTIFENSCLIKSYEGKASEKFATTFELIALQPLRGKNLSGHLRSNSIKQRLFNILM